MFPGDYEEGIAWVYSKLLYPTMRGKNFCVEFYAREGLGTRREIFFVRGCSRQRHVQGLLCQDAEIRPGSACTMTARKPGSERFRMMPAVTPKKCGCGMPARC